MRGVSAVSAVSTQCKGGEVGNEGEGEIEEVESEREESEIEGEKRRIYEEEMEDAFRKLHCAA